MIRNTSLKAYINEVAPVLGARQIAVLEAFEHEPGRDFTNAELGRALGWEINRITGRTNELRKLGILEESRRRQCGVTLREVHAWRIKERPVVSPKAISPVPNRYQMPSLSQPGKTHSIVATEREVTCDCKGFYFRKTCSHIAGLRKAAERVNPEEAMTPML